MHQPNIGNYQIYKNFINAQLRFPVAQNFPPQKHPHLHPQLLQNSKTIVKQPSQALRLLQTSMFETSQALVKSPASWRKPLNELGGLLQVCL